MNDRKSTCRTEREHEIQLQVIKNFSQDMRLEFGLIDVEKCYLEEENLFNPIDY
jgi:hypothetical protein